MQHILLKTTTLPASDHYHIGHFSYLAEYLRGLRDSDGRPRFTVDTRDRCEDERGNDPDLVNLLHSPYQQLWLFGVEDEGGLSYADLMAINAFRQRGGGLFLSRGPGDMGASLALLETVGAAQHFPSMQVSDEDEPGDGKLSLPPVYCSGAIGEAQAIHPQQPTHPLLWGADGEILHQLPACPAEGEVVVPEGSEAVAQVIATGESQSPAGHFNIAVCFERYRDRWGELTGRALAEAAFLRFCNGQLSPDSSNSALASARAYIRNIALWLSGLDPSSADAQH